MHIKLSPQRREDRLVLERRGDILVVNGEEYDFSKLLEGYILPRSAVNCAWLVSDVKRADGAIWLTIILPHGASAPEITRYPSPILNPADGVIVLPPYDRDGA